MSSTTAPIANRSDPGGAREGAGRARIGALEMLVAAATLGLAGTVFFFHLGAYGLWEPDEARYAEIAREMLALREGLVPHLNYVAYIEKPPLLYWLTAGSFKLFGLNELAARMVPAASSLVSVLATLWFATRGFGRRHGIMAAAILATAPLYAVMAQVLTTDMLLSALVTVAGFALFFHYQRSGGWCWLAYVAMALAALTKGPIGIAMPAASMAIFLLWQGELRGSIRRFHALAGLVLMLAIAAPWFVIVSVKEPGFAYFYFVGEHLGRIFEPSYSHGGPFYYYLAVLAGGLLPWSLLVPFLTWRRLAPSPARRFCVVSSIVIVGGFSLASAKLIPYVLPAFPPLAVLLADGIVSCAWPQESAARGVPAPDSRILIEAGPLLSLIGAGVIIAALKAASFSTPYAMLAQPAMYAIGGILVFGGAMTTLAFLARLTGAGLSLIVVTMAGALCAGTWARLYTEPLRSYAALSRTIEERASGATLICYHQYVQGLPFYTHQRVVMVKEPLELKFGADRAPDAAEYFLRSDEDLLYLWDRPGEKVLVLDAFDLARLKSRLGTFTVIGAEHTKRAIVNSSEQLARD